MLRFLTAGESHGPAEVAILEGIPAGLPISTSEINTELKKRMHDFGRGGREKIEKDEVKILSGVRFGKTLGSPIALLVETVDQAKWEEKVTRPRPGHADLAGVLKYGFDDVRNVLERASARETVMRVAIGAICKKLLLEFGTQIASHTIQIGKIKSSKQNYSFEEIAEINEIDPDVHCVDEKSREQMKQEITNARMNKNTLGGVLEVIAHNVPIGLGSYVAFDRRIDGRIAQALMSIPSVKAVEIGNAIEAAGKTGKEVQDEIIVKDKKITRSTNNMGGIEGGITNGEDIFCRVFHKPISTLYDPLKTVDISSLEPATATIQRSDVCVVARAGVISQAMLAFVLADAMLDKFGGDSIEETKRNFESYQKNLKIKI
ncbi:MAG: chorismate synthase [Candidatus Levybacteria bacterium]|nr:chorismate synthase [Candidatus Levybacteria bacterium]